MYRCAGCNVEKSKGILAPPLCVVLGQLHPTHCFKGPHTLAAQAGCSRVLARPAACLAAPAALAVSDVLPPRRAPLPVARAALAGADEGREADADAAGNLHGDVGVGVMCQLCVNQVSRSALTLTHLPRLSGPTLRHGVLKVESLTPSAPRRASGVNKATGFPIP